MNVHAVVATRTGEEDSSACIAKLTPMQQKVLLGVVAGQLNKQIAFELNVAEATVKAHMTAILRKLRVSNRTQAALAWSALDQIPPAHSELSSKY